MTQPTITRPSPTPDTRPGPTPKRPFARHNHGTVVGFEFTRTLKKRGFWIATLSIPVVMAIVFALIYLSNSSTAASEDAQKTAAGLNTPTMAVCFECTTRTKMPMSELFDLAWNIDAHKDSMRQSREEAINGVTSGLIS